LGDIELLASGLPPLSTPDLRSYDKAFSDAFLHSIDVEILVAYVSSDAVVELVALAKAHAGLESLNLTVGMAAFDGFFESQMVALTELDGYLTSRELGGVFVETALPVHAKLSSFRGPSVDCAIVGSSNLSGLVSTFRQFEVDLLIQSKRETQQIRDFIIEARKRTSIPLLAARPKIKIASDPNVVLDGVPNVSRVDPGSIQLTAISFQLPVKVSPRAPKSNVNAHFGKPRKAPIPRPWYEVEIIVGKKITSLPGYPRKGEKFEVVTDDGWRFPCEVQGQNSKNFRSSGDLKTLGKWLKVRLQNAGSLVVGSVADEMTLKKYGRDYLTITQTTEPSVWFLDFARP
jgi:hypothetical protein